MQTLTIKRKSQNCKGEISIPSSKTYIHRFLLSALLAEGESVIENVTLSDDVKSTIECVKALGASVRISENSKTLFVTGAKSSPDFAKLYCNECGSTLRFIIPVALALCGKAEFSGSKKLLERPLEQYFKIFDENNIKYDFKKGEYLKAEGIFSKNEFHIDGGVSSQFVTGMLYAAALCENDSTIIIDTPLRSKPYVDVTLEVLSRSGIEVENRNYESFFVKGGQKFAPAHFTACGDWSQTAFFLVAGAIGGDITVKNINFTSGQGDAVIAEILKKMGADITLFEDRVEIKRSMLVSPDVIDAENFPDLVPVLALALSLAEGTTRVYGIERLRFKECDRIEATRHIISSLGGNIVLKDNAFEITGVKKLCGGKVKSFNDHRIAMTEAVACLACDGEVTIENPMCINKSYPDFYEDLLSTGGVEYEWNMG